MRKKHVITELSLNEISAVDHPAQVHARAMILKRAEPAEQEQTTDVTALCALAKSVAFEPVGSREYARFVRTYDVYRREQAEAASPGLAQRIEKKRTAEAALKALAEEIANETGCKLPEAYVQACDTPEGAALYASARII